jgi:hypothetical protein
VNIAPGIVSSDSNQLDSSVVHESNVEHRS